MLANYAQVVQFYSVPLACFVDALDSQADSHTHKYIAAVEPTT